MTNDVAFDIQITLAVYSKQMVLMGSIAVLVDCIIVPILMYAFEFGAGTRSMHNDTIFDEIASDGGGPGGSQN